MLNPGQLRTLRTSVPEGRNRLRKALELAGMTQIEFARALDISGPYANALIYGHYRRLPLETARRVAALFGCSIEELFPSVVVTVAVA